ncbi:MAG: beta-N-acetylglucosaminidase domain-containing protein [Schwartzia sp.]|nr:beta-N-acetylglucosaminidase domain-containing protein [Schwartzia sp. (in: firmicutes)]
MNWKKIAATILCALSVQGAAFAAPIPLRGIVEGFYGKPWTQEQRIDMMAFCEAHGLNAYIYAPKDDPYHREKWREPYPEAQIKKLAALIGEAQRHHVKFIFALSPGLDNSYTPLRGAMDRKKLLEKLESVYALGVRDFAVFFDDITEKDGQGQAELLRWLDAHFVKPRGDVSPLLTVPTEYFLPDMRGTDGKAKPYTKDFSLGLPKDALPLFTGDGVVMQGLSGKTLDDTERLYGRRLGLWWNYPVNDYMEAKLALGPVEKLPEAGIPAIFFNPMSAAELSKISLATGAAYALAPESYEPQAAWEKAIREQYKELAPQMTLFAGQSQHLENNWANIGRQDGEALRAEIEDFWRAWPKGEGAEAKRAALREKFSELAAAAKTLRSKLPGKKLRECKPQLKQLELLAEADVLALDWLEAIRAGDEKRAKKLEKKMGKKREKIVKNEDAAKISETVCRAFLDEALKKEK